LFHELAAPHLGLQGMGLLLQKNDLAEATLCVCFLRVTLGGNDAIVELADTLENRRILSRAKMVQMISAQARKSVGTSQIIPELFETYRGLDTALLAEKIDHFAVHAQARATLRSLFDDDADVPSKELHVRHAVDQKALERTASVDKGELRRLACADDIASACGEAGAEGVTMSFGRDRNERLAPLQAFGKKVRRGVEQKGIVFVKLRDVTVGELAGAFGGERLDLLAPEQAHAANRLRGGRQTPIARQKTHHVGGKAEDAGSIDGGHQVVRDSRRKT
jgi:hypothetical protein